MSKKKMNRFYSILFGVAVSLTVCITAIACLSHLYLSGRIGEIGCEMGINIVIMLSVLVSSLVSLNRFGKNFVEYITLTVVLLITMISGALLIDGAFKNVMPRLLSMMLGTAMSCAISMKTNVKKKNRKRRYR